LNVGDLNPADCPQHQIGGPRFNLTVITILSRILVHPGYPPPWVVHFASARGTQNPNAETLLNETSPLRSLLYGLDQSTGIARGICRCRNRRRSPNTVTASSARAVAVDAGEGRVRTHSLSQAGWEQLPGIGPVCSLVDCPVGSDQRVPGGPVALGGRNSLILPLSEWRAAQQGTYRTAEPKQSRSSSPLRTKIGRMRPKDLLVPVWVFYHPMSLLRSKLASANSRLERWRSRSWICVCPPRPGSIEQCRIE
jgi:hypothetical protein